MIAQAGRLVRGVNARPYIVHVDDSAPYFAAPGSMVPPEDAKNIPDGEDIDLESVQEQLEREGVSADFEQLGGPTANDILAVSDRIGADYIVMGSQRHGRLYHLLLGVPSASIVHRSRCIVVIVPDPESASA